MVPDVRKGGSFLPRPASGGTPSVGPLRRSRHRGGRNACPGPRIRVARGAGNPRAGPVEVGRQDAPSAARNERSSRRPNGNESELRGPTPERGRRDPLPRPDTPVQRVGGSRGRVGTPRPASGESHPGGGPGRGPGRGAVRRGPPGPLVPYRRFGTRDCRDPGTGL